MRRLARPTLALLAVVGGVLTGSALRAAAIPSDRPAAPALTAAMPCRATHHFDLRYDPAMATTVVDAVRLVAPGCPDGPVLALIDVGAGAEVAAPATLEGGRGRATLERPIPAAEVIGLRLRLP